MHFVQEASNSRKPVPSLTCSLHFMLWQPLNKIDMYMSEVREIVAWLKPRKVY